MFHSLMNPRFCALLIVSLVVVSIQSNAVGQNWPQFRGHHANGVADTNPPTQWDTETGENIKWASDIPGLGHSSPVIWEDRIFLTTAVNDKMDAPTLQTGWLGGTGKAAADEGEWTWQIICIDRNNGKTLWTKDLAKGTPAIKRHLKATHANCSCATNGEMVIAFFGSEGIYCLDMEGNLIWTKDFGKLHSGPYNATDLEWGFSSSPIIFEDKVVVQCDCLNDAFVSVLDLKTGDEVRRIQRDEVSTWSTPLVLRFEDHVQLICNGFKQMAGYDFQTGETLWTLSGGGDVPVPTPLFANGKILLTNGHGRSPTYAIDPSARGDISPPSSSDEELPKGLVWYQPRDGAYMPTPIAIDRYLYTFDDNGKLTVRDIEDGAQIYKRRLASNTFSASPVGTPQKIYVTAEDGSIFVVRTGKEYELLATNQMNQITMATPAIAGDQLFVRTSTQLVCIAESSE